MPAWLRFNNSLHLFRNAMHIVSRRNCSCRLSSRQILQYMKPRRRAVASHPVESQAGRGFRRFVCAV